jgi:ABC-2 type transport system permease protein
VRKELIQIRRDPRLLRLVFVAPAFQLIAFGYAVSTDIRDTATFVVDHDRSAASRELLDAFTASGYFRVSGGSTRSADLTAALDHGRAVVGLEIPAGYSRDRARGEARVQLIFDGTNSNLATVAMGYASRIVQTHGARLMTTGAATPIDLRARAWFNPDLASRNYNVPAVLGLVVLLLCLLLTALAIVREREVGTLEQLLVSPLTPGELIAGKTIPFALIALLDLTLVTTIARLWFRVPFEGSLVLFVVASLFYILCGLALGLLISTVSSTQREAFLSTFLLFMPTVLLSGFMFPVSSMPEPVQWVTIGNPLCHYLVIVRGIFLKDAGIGVLWPQLTAVGCTGLVIFVFASRRFRAMHL